MKELLLKLKGWQLFILLSTYWLVLPFVKQDSFVLDVLFILNMGLLLYWYISLICSINGHLTLKLKYIPLVILISILLFIYTILDSFFTDSIIVDSAIIRYAEVLGYLFVVTYVTLCFNRAENKLRIKSADLLITFILFFFYPIGVFFINRRLKNILSLNM
jgi:hypothetical protein